VHSSAGTTVSAFRPLPPATYNEAGYEAITFTPIGEVTDTRATSAANMRTSSSTTRSPPGPPSKLKGSYNEGQIQLQFGLDNRRCWPDRCSKTASTSDERLQLPRRHPGWQRLISSRAQVTSFKTSVGGVDDITAGSATLEITSNDAGIGVVKVAGS
jgi:hypothetical protein